MIRANDIKRFCRGSITTNGVTAGIRFKLFPDEDITVIEAHLKMGNDSGVVIVSVPNFTHDNFFIFNGLERAGLVKALKPVMSVEEDARGVIRILITHLAPDVNDIDISFRDGRIVRRWGERFVNNFAQWQLRSFWLTKEDRDWINSFLGIRNNAPYLTVLDIAKLERLVGSGKIEPRSWKNVKDMRLFTLPETLAAIIWDKLHRVVREHKIYGMFRTDIVQAAVSQYLGGSPQSQLVENGGVHGKAIASKVALPIERWADINEVKIDPSWHRIFCSIDTPQSSDCGKVVAWANGAGRNEDGSVRSGNSFWSETLAQNPWLVFQHEARWVIDAATMKQSVPLDNPEVPKVVPVDFTGKHSVQGKHVLAAVMDYRGWTHEDGMVISKRMVKHFRTRITRTVRLRSSIEPPKLAIGANIGDIIHPNQFLGVQRTLDGWEVVTANIASSGIVKNVKHRKSVGAIGIEYLMDIQIDVPLAVRRGDKLSGLHGNKGIVTLILPDDRMPLIEEGPYRGNHVDIIVSPNTIGKRKNVSMILEMMFNTYLEVKGEQSMKVDVKDPAFSFEHIGNKLESMGIPKNIMYSVRIGGNTLPNKVLIGPLFMMRLSHHAAEKLRFRGEWNRGCMDHRGFAIDGSGAQRFGQDELCALVSHGVPNAVSWIKRERDENTPAMKEWAKEVVRCLGY